MVLRSLFFVAALAASVVKSAPLKLEDRQAPSGVPDYVTKYGMYHQASLPFQLHQLVTSESTDFVSSDSTDLFIHKSTCLNNADPY